MNKPLIIISLLLTFFVSNVQAQDTDSLELLRLSLAEAQQYALENNDSIKNAKIDIQIAEEKVWESTAMGLPHVDVSLSFQYNFTVPEMEMMNFDPSSMVFSEQGLVDEFAVSTQKMELGSKQNTTIDFTLSQLIFSGEYLVGLQAAKVYREMSARQLEKTEISLGYNVAQSYYMVLVARENLRILDSSLTNTEEIFEQTKILNRQGFVEQTDVDQLELSLATLRNTKNMISRQLELASLLFKLQVGIPLQQPVELTQELESLVSATEVQRLLTEELTVEEHIDYKMLETQAGLLYLDHKRYQSAYLPTVSAYYRHQEQLNAPDFNFMPPDVVGVQASIPIFSCGERRSRVRQAQYEIDKIDNIKNSLERGLTLNILQAKSELQTAWDNYETEKHNLELAQRIYDRTLIKYQNGMASSLDLTQAQTQFLDVQSKYFNAMLEVLTGKVAVERALNKQSQE